MSVGLSYPHIEKVEGEPARLNRLPRVRVAQLVMDQLAHAWSAEEIFRQCPHLTRAEVHSALAYYFDHQAEIDGEIQEEWKQSEDARRQAQPSPLQLRLRAKGLI